MPEESRPGTDFSRLPRWPEGARDLADDTPPERYRAMWVGGGVGGLLGLIQGCRAIAGPGAGGVAAALIALVGSAVFLGLAGMLVGYVIDRGRWLRNRRRRDG